MESTNTKVEIMKPVFLKTGIPIAITVAGFIFARFTSRRGSVLKASSAENHVNSVEADSHKKHRGEGSSSTLESPDSPSLSCVEDNHSSTDTSDLNLEENLQCQHKDELEEEILGFRCRLQDLQDRELELEAKYLHYHDMKEQEIVLIRLQDKLLLEITKVEFLEMEISLVEAEIHRFQNIVVEYLETIELLEITRTENELLQRKVKKLLRKMTANSNVIREQRVHIEAKKAEISRNYEELERMTNTIRKMEEEIDELKTAVGRLQSENTEQLNQIELANKAASSKIEAEEATIADYSRVVCELEELEKVRAVEVNELIYLRWCNACLRHELMRRNQEEQDQEVGKEQMELNFGEIPGFESDNEQDRSTLRHGDSCLGFPTTGHAHTHSKKRKFIEKLKRWMDGGEKTEQKFNEKAKHETEYFGKHSVPDGEADHHIPAKKS